MELENERKNQIDETLAKYAISSLDEAKKMCEEKGINVEEIVKAIKPDISELAILAYYIGTAISIKKETRLSSYAAMDLGEGIQSLCIPETECYENRSGLGHGYQASNYIKNNFQNDSFSEDDINDYASELSFLELSNDELLRITAQLAKEIEKHV